MIDHISILEFKVILKNIEFCTEMVSLKYIYIISLGSKLLIKLICDTGNSNNDNLFMQKPQTIFQMPPLRTTVFELFQISSLSTTVFELSGFQMSPLSTVAIDTLKTRFHILRYVCRSLFKGPCIRIENKTHTCSPFY